METISVIICRLRKAFVWHLRNRTMTVNSQLAGGKQQQIRMLIVEDENEFVEVTRESLALIDHMEFLIESRSTLTEAIERLKQQDVDIVLLDLGLPDSDRPDTFDRIAPHVAHLPVIIISGHDDEDLAIQTVQAGAQDYLVKGQIDAPLLVRVTRHAIERKRLEESLRDRETFFRLITENVQDLIAVLDRDGKRLYTSPSYRELLDDHDERLGADSFDSIHPEDLPRVRRLFDETVASGIGRRAEYRFLSKSGQIRFIESQGSVIKDRLGQTEKVVVVSRDVTERKQAENELRKSEQRYKHLLGTVTDYIYSVQLNENGHVTTTHSPSCVNVTGHTAEELQQNPLLGLSMIPAGDRPLVDEMITHARAGQVAESIEHRIRHKDGSIRWVRATTVPHVDPNGRVTSYDGLVSDITEKREAVNQLRASEEHYQSLVESLPQCIMRKDMDGRFTFVNRQFAKLIGREPWEIIGKTDFDFYPVEMAEKFREDDQQVMSRGELLEVTEENVTANGISHFVHVVKIPIRNHRETTIGVQCIFWDVTAAKRTQEELRKREALLQALMDQTPAVIYLKDLQGRYLYINREFEKLFHLKRETTVTKTDFDIFPPDFAQRFHDNDLMILAGGKPCSIDEQAPHDDGPHDYLSVKFPIFDLNGKPYALCGISTDITDRKRFTETLRQKNKDLKKALGELSATRMQLIHAEKLKSIGTLAAGVAHEVKNPLQTLLLSMDGLACLIPESDNETQMTLNDMREAVKRADGIIHSLLDFSRLEKLTLRPANMNTVIRDVLKLMKYPLLDAHITVKVKEELLPEVMIDRQKMNQVFVNLITNSLHAMERGGEILITTKCRFLGEDEMLAGLGDTSHFVPGDRLVTVEIFDNGGGIPPEVLPRIFDPFFTTKPPGRGTGLGLPVAQNIITLHNGNINIENHPDGGVHVVITLKHRKKKHEQKENPDRG